MQAVSRQVFCFEGFTLDLRRGCLRSDDREIELRPKSFEVLRYLVEHAGRLVPKDEFVKAVWPNVIVSDESLTRCMSEVRLALGDGDQHLIKTVPRRGYLFTAPVSLPVAYGPSVSDPKPTATPAASEMSTQTAPQSNISVQVGERDHGWAHWPAERRQITVMFCDLVGSSALSALDPEDLQKVLAAFHSSCAEVISRFGGMVARFSGGGILAYFGFPQAHEHDAEQAVRAGLGVVNVVTRITAGMMPPLHVCVGIATGLVLVGDLGDHHSLNDAVVGGTPNLAFRLQGIADPDAVVIAASTRGLVRGLFECRELGSVSWKGFSDPERVYRVLEEKEIESRFKALHESGLTPLIGREHEIALLLDRWDLAKGGEGQVVLLGGEPGIGKSRIAETLRERLLADEPHLLLRYQGSPQRTASALHPVIARLEHAAGFRRKDDPEARLAKLEDLLGREVKDVSAVAPLFAALLAIRTEGRYPPLGLTPPQQKAKTLEALAGQLEAMAARRPVLLVFEDLHWADPTSLELLDIVVDRTRHLPVLAVLTFRPDFAPPWTGHAHVTLLSLNRLGRRDTAALAERVGGGKPLPPEVLDQILVRTDGVPLFVEELTRTVLESGLLSEGVDGYVLRGPLPPLAIPATLHDSLMARLDRLAPPVKAVAQLAACIGREFSHEMLAAVSPLGADALGVALDQLVASELIHRGGMPSAVSYAFRHALVHEAAYQSLLRSRRQQLHACIAQIVEARFPEITARQPDWLAHQYAEAGLAERASDCSFEAARCAKAAYALREAAAHLENCLDVALTSSLAGGDPQASVPGTRQLEALVLLGDVASLMGDLDGANKRYEQALDLVFEADTRTRIENKRHRSRVAIRGGARIVFYEHGGGEDTLLFVSPLAYGLAAIQPILERLCQEFRIVTIDPRGSGASELLTRPYRLDEHVKDVQAVLAALGRPVVGVGISAGANLLLKLAHADPRLFAKLVTVGAPPSDFSRAFHPSYLERHKTDLEKQDVSDVVRSHTELVFSEPEMRELREQTISSRLQLPCETILSFFDPDPGKDVMPLLADIRLPVLVTHGRKDRLLAFAAAEQIAARLPNAQLYAFEGKGHLPIFTATDEFCEVLRRFVRTGTATA